VHAAVVLGLILTPVPHASTWSSSRSKMPDGERHIVQVTMLMNTTDFSPQPAEAPVEASEQQPIEKVPPSPVAVPELAQTPDDLPPSTQPTTAKPPAPKEPIALEAQVPPERQPIALDLPKTDRRDAPLPPIAALFEPEPNALPEPTDPVQVPDALTQAALPDVPVTEAPTQLPSGSDRATKPTQATSEVAEAQQTPPDEPAAQTADTNQASEASAARADASEKEQADDPPAEVYDEDSVDRGITFGKKVRPEPPMVSKRRGESGNVRILIEVDANGELIRHEVLDDAGFPRLLEAALKALRDSTFEPATVGDRPVHSTRVIEYRF